MTGWLQPVVTYWSAGGWLCLPIAGASFGIWYYFLRTRSVLVRMQTHPLAASGPGGGETPADFPEDLLSRDFVVLAAWTAAAPLLGLAGTVLGMIRTFSAVAQVSGAPGVRVAEGISQALITTQAGLVVAIPGLFGLARLQRLLAHARAHQAGARLRLVTPAAAVPP